MHSIVEPLLSSPRSAVTPEIRHLGIRPNAARAVLVVPEQTSREIKFIPAESSHPPVDVNRLGVPDGTSNGWTENPIINSIANSSSNFALPPTPPRQPPRISRMMEGDLIRRVQPLYPPLARQARVQGQVVLRAIIRRDGVIENLQVLSGHPMLLQAAIDAVKQWRYRPYSLNGEPVEVETQVTMNFVLSGG